MTELENEGIKHAIYYEHYKTGIANDILNIIKKANREIVKEIKQTDIISMSRYKKINKLLKDITKDIKTQVDNEYDIDGVIEYELRKQKKFLNMGTEKINVDFIYPSLKQIKTSALFSPIVPNMTYATYLNDIKEGLFNQWDTALRTGYLTNETTKNIINKVMGKVSPAQVLNKGTMQSFYNSIYRNTRTALQSFANTTRTMIYYENRDIIKKVRFLATLDRRTCLVCGNLDGKIFDLDKAPVLPLHFNCRCVEIPIIKGADVTKNTRPMEGGTTKGTVTFNDWLKNQNDKTLMDVLGKTRYKMYKDGTAINEFIENNSILTLKELNIKLDNKI